jgi:hypothetical protein
MITLDENERVDFIGLDKILQDYWNYSEGILTL